VGVVIDHFGKDVMIHKKDEEHFTVRVRIRISSQFFGWLAGLGPGAVIVSPEPVRKEYTNFLKRALENYHDC
jgi:predicted DNA-binding transcriptional regulator YafY